MRVLVCGGRAFANYEWLEKELDRLHRHHRFTVLIHGAARGADALAERWAFYNRVDIEKYPAMWAKHGNKKAGPIRNTQMLQEGKPELVVAFRGGAGTKDMVRKARAAGVPVIDLA